MKNGVYALVALNGAPLDPGDEGVLFAGMDGVARHDGCALAGIDLTASVHIRRTPDGIDLLLGALDEPGDAARRLAARDGADQLDLTLAGLARWGSDAATKLPGEWLLARWRARERMLVLLTSACLRDPCYVATDGTRVAIAPDLIRLARLDWIDDAPDPEMLWRQMLPGGTDPGARRRTMLRQVTQLLPGELVTIATGGIAIADAAEDPPPPLNPLPFDAAMAGLEAALARIVRRQLARSGDVAILLSGGLDSSLVAALATAERRPGQRLVCLTSAAPQDSGIADESAWAECVAGHLGLPLERVAPALDTDIYRLRPARMLNAAGPMLAPRHFLDDALEDAALAAGVSHLFEGGYGELTVSGYGPPRGMRPGLSALRSLRAKLKGRGDPADRFIVRPSAAALALSFPTGRPWTFRAGPDGAYGFHAGSTKAAFRTTGAGDPRLRYFHPFRDRGFGRLMAELPAGYVAHGGTDRAPIRALLSGRVPDRIVRRQSKMAYSPTYFAMLQRQAGTALARIAGQRAAGAGEWVDLAWLEACLNEAMRGRQLSRELWSQVHITALFADFFDWWPRVVRGRS